MQATAINKIVSALNHAVAEGFIEDHNVKYLSKKPRYARREVIPTMTQQQKMEQGAHHALKQILSALRLPPGRPGWFPTQAPHRSVLAQLRHTAPHVTFATGRHTEWIAIAGGSG